MALAADQIEALHRLGLDFTVADENGMTCVTIRDFRLPAGFARPSSNLLIRLAYFGRLDQLVRPRELPDRWLEQLYFGPCSFNDLGGMACISSNVGNQLRQTDGYPVDRHTSRHADSHPVDQGSSEELTTTSGYLTSLGSGQIAGGPF